MLMYCLWWNFIDEVIPAIYRRYMLYSSIAWFRALSCALTPLGLRGMRIEIDRAVRAIGVENRNEFKSAPLTPSCKIKRLGSGWFGCLVSLKGVHLRGIVYNERSNNDRCRDMKVDYALLAFTAELAGSPSYVGKLGQWCHKSFNEVWVPEKWSFSTRTTEFWRIILRWRAFFSNFWF